MIDPSKLPPMPQLMIPGPGDLHDEDLEVFGGPIIAHYGDVWTQLYNQVVGQVADILGAHGGVYLVPGSGSLAIEMGMRNLFEPGSEIVIPNTGFFGERGIQVAKALGLVVREVEVTLGRPVDVAKIAEAAKGADGIASVHAETSTGVRHPIEEIAAIARKEGIRYVVDGVASAAADYVAVDDMGIDIFVTASQKGLEAPAGLGILTSSKECLKFVKKRRFTPGTWFLDIAVWEHYIEQWGNFHPHPMTLPGNTVLALASSVKRIVDFGVKEWIERHGALAKRLREGLADLGMPPIPESGAEANLIVVSQTDQVEKMTNHFLANGIMIGAGLGPTHGKAVRIGLMGRSASDEMVDRVIELAAESLK